MKENEKKPYVTPELTVHGDVEVITLAGSSTGQLDANYPAGTPDGNIFS